MTRRPVITGHSWRPNADGDPYCSGCGVEPWELRAKATCPGTWPDTPKPTTEEAWQPTAQP